MLSKHPGFRRNDLEDLKAELEMPAEEDVQALREQIQGLRATMQLQRDHVKTLEIRHNELVTWLAQQYPKDDRAYMMRFLKVTEVDE